jgi:hypothetical protein
MENQANKLFRVQNLKDSIVIEVMNYLKIKNYIFLMVTDTNNGVLTSFALNTS